MSAAFARRLRVDPSATFSRLVMFFLEMTSEKSQARMVYTNVSIEENENFKYFKENANFLKYSSPRRDQSASAESKERRAFNRLLS